MMFGPNRNEGGNTFWKDLLLVALPAAIASIGPVVVGHWLSKSNRKETKEEEGGKAEK